MEKLKVAIFFGGQSAEHEISLRSANNIIQALDRSKYHPYFIGIEKNGQWYHYSAELFSDGAPAELESFPDKKRLLVRPGNGSQEPVFYQEEGEALQVDLLFPVLHGTAGEDGSIQGLFKLLNLPYVGASLLGSAVGMDKDVMKRLLRDGGIPIGDFLTFHLEQQGDMNFEDVKTRLGLPFYIKPCNLGSSVGISRVSCREEFLPAVKEAFSYDRKIIIEKNIVGREVECALLGNFTPWVSPPGEIITQGGFYSYKAKYLDEQVTSFQMPADLPAEVTQSLQEIAVKSYQLLCCEGLARLDVFVTPASQVLVNEINTIPGFTSISMYPKLWELTGMGTTPLIDRLIELALERFKQESGLATTL